MGLADCYVALEIPEKGLQVLTSAVNDIEEPKDITRLYRSIGDVHEKMGNSTMRAIALQKALEFSPENTSVLFSAAYSQGDSELPLLCLFNYQTLLQFKPTDTSGLNNLGVVCDNLELPIMSASSYKKATDQGNTLSMANLAFRYMNQGFEMEAQELIDKARKEDECHRNVGQAMTTLHGKKEKEAEALNEIKAKALKQKDFFWEYADAYYMHSNNQHTFVGCWESSNGKVFTISQDVDNITAKHENEGYWEKFEGTVHNRAVTLKYQRKGSLNLLTDLGSPLSQEGFAYITKDGSRIHLHTYEKRNTFFLELKKVNGKQK